MSFKEIREWLSEYKSLKREELNSYASTVRNREELFNAIGALFDGDLSNEFVEPVCHQIFEFFKAGHIELRRFTLDLLPNMVYTYLTAISRGEKRKCSGLEACLLGIYNLEVVTEDGKPKAEVFTIPTLAVPSIYHEPPSLATLALTESSLLRYHSDEPITVTLGPLPQVESINAQNRMSVLKYILKIYNADIKNSQPKSHFTLCKVCARIAKQGFDHIEDIGIALVTIDLNDSMSSTSSRSSRRSVKFNSANDARIPLDSEFLVEALTGLYFTMFNGQPHPSIEALNFIHKRACYERFSDVLLVTNAIRNSLQYNPSGQPQDGPMGISVALSPQQRDEKLSKRAITNASFRGKRLPEDIPVMEEEYFSVDESPKPMNRVNTDSLDRSISQTNSIKQKEEDFAKSFKRKHSSFRDKIVSFTKLKSASFDKKDIEVVNGENQSENPPHYDEVVDSDHSIMKESTSSESKTKSSSGPSKLQQLSHPLKSIMKKGSDRSSEKPEKAKVHRKESSDTQKHKSGKHERDRSDRDSTSETNSPRSPKHSHSSQFTNGTTSNGDIVDLSYVQVQVTDGSGSGRRMHSDNVEMVSLSSQSSHDKYHDASATVGSNHAPEGFAAHLREKLTKSHSKDQRLKSGGVVDMPSSSSSKESLNTHL